MTPANFLVSEIPYMANFSVSVIQGSNEMSTNRNGYVGDLLIMPDGISIFGVVSNFRERGFH